MIKRRKIGIIGYGVMGQHIETFLIEQEGSDVLDIYYFDDFLYNNGRKNAFKFNNNMISYLGCEDKLKICFVCFFDC